MAQTIETVMPNMSDIERDFLMFYRAKLNSHHYWGKYNYLQVPILKSLII